MNRYRQLIRELDEVTDEDLIHGGMFPQRKQVIRLMKEIQALMFPDYYQYHDLFGEELVRSLETDIRETMMSELFHNNEKVSFIEKNVNAFLQQLPEVKSRILTDIQAIYDGDPAAKSKAQVILCYPGFYAIFIYRIAHILYVEGFYYIARIMSEYAHEKTGIDINPGAKIGEYFCIDHGTGIVIGETARLGHHVKLYQGVTIGAKSFEMDENGFPVKGGKRHPDIGNHVVVYANATILGGTTVIGNNSVIGANTWITSSVAENTTIYYTK